MMTMQGDQATMQWRGALAVLTNGGTAAGAEMVAAALQDNGRALILGQPTRGAGDLTRFIPLDRFAQSAGSSLGSLALATGAAFRANGQSISGLGVQPDIRLSLAYRAVPGVDRPEWPLVPIDAAPTTSLMDLQKVLPQLREDHEKRIGAARLSSEDACANLQLPLRLAERKRSSVQAALQACLPTVSSTSTADTDRAVLGAVAAIVAESRQLLEHQP